MKVTKHYEQDHVILYVSEGKTIRTTITLDSDAQIRRLGQCLIDLEGCDSARAETKARFRSMPSVSRLAVGTSTDGREVTIEPRTAQGT